MQRSHKKVLWNQNKKQSTKNKQKKLKMKAFVPNVLLLDFLNFHLQPV